MDHPAVVRRADLLEDGAVELDAQGVAQLLDFDYEELSDALGVEFDGSVFEEISSTHYGRMVHLDDKTILFASPEDAAEYIGFDLVAN